MTKTEWDRKLRWHCKMILSLADKNAPDVVMGHAIANLFHQAIARYGNDVAGELARWLIEDARMGSGLCQTCDNEILARKTFKPVCEQCEAKATAEGFEFDLKYPSPDECCRCKAPDDGLLYVCVQCHLGFCAKCFTKEERDRWSCNDCEAKREK